jgi:hypothetical protein
MFERHPLADDVLLLLLNARHLAEPCRCQAGSKRSENYKLN